MYNDDLKTVDQMDLCTWVNSFDEANQSCQFESTGCVAADSDHARED